MKNLCAALMLLATAYPAAADPARDAILKNLANQASVSSFSAAAGKAFFQGTHQGGKPESPSCTSCHTKNPTKQGRTRIGKIIEPMAVSVMPSRFTDPEKVDKWFRRNCNSVLGRECSANEKGDILIYLMTQ